MACKSRVIETTSTNYLKSSLFFFLLTVMTTGHAWAQSVIATVTVGSAPEGVAADTVTNQIYVANFHGGNISPSTVTVIDGATNATSTVPAGVRPVAVAVNEVTNRIYVANLGDCSPLGICNSEGGVTVIDGATNSTTTITDSNANGPRALAVNEATNKVYVANLWSGNVTVIDGATNSTTTISLPNASGLTASAIALSQVTNRIYVLNNDGTGLTGKPGNITVIDGSTNSTTTITDPNAVFPLAVAVNPVTNKIYVANLGDYPGSNHGNVTVIDAATNTTTTITDPSALAPQAVAVDTVTNMIYVANANDSALTGIGGVTIIDGITDAISTVRDPNAMFPQAIAVDSVTNTIYVANQGCFPPADPCTNPGSVTVINGSTNSVSTIIDPNARNPTGLTLDPSTDKTYVANVSSNNVTVIDGGATATTQTLSLLLAGSGSGTVTSNPSGVNCPTSCSSSFPSGSVVNLAASAASGSAFAGWSGACSGTGGCSATMTGAEFVTATFNTLPPDFSLSAATPGLTVQPGGQMTDIITIAPQNGSFASAIQLSCAVSGPSPVLTCALSPTSVTPGANSASSALTINAPAASATLRPIIGQHLNECLCAALLPMGVCMVILGGGSRRNRRRQLLLCSLLPLQFLLLAGCGNSGSQQGTSNYTVTITGTSGATHHTTQVVVTVQ